MTRASPAAPAANGPLAGLLVADFSRVLAAPYATMLLADLGAEVVKVEQPGVGDGTRAWGPPYAHGQSTYFQSVNRNKRSWVADLRDPDDLRRAAELIRRADVVFENFRPGTMAGYGLDYERAAAGNPGLVYCSISGFGAGAGAALPGYDLLVQAVGGLMSVTGPEPGRPVKTGVAVVDVLTGLHAAVGVLAALRERETSGRGQHVEVNLLSSLLSGLVNQAAGYTLAGSVPGILGDRHPSIAPYEVFHAADRPLVVAVGTDRQFAALCAGIGAPELAADPRSATNPDRVAHVEELARQLNAILGGRPAQEWFDALTAVGVPCGPVNDLAQAFELAERLGLEPRARIRIEEAETAAGSKAATHFDMTEHGDVAERSAATERSASETDAEAPPVHPSLNLTDHGPVDSDGGGNEGGGVFLDLVANPIGLSRTPPAYRSAPPRLGEHSREIARWLDGPARPTPGPVSHDEMTYPDPDLADPDPDDAHDDRTDAGSAP